MKWKISFLALCLAGPAWAAVDNSMPPGGVFGLKPGIYAQKTASCKKATASSVKIYDGKALYAPSSRACIARITSRDGTRYTVTQSCLSSEAADAARRDETYVIRVSDALNFSTRAGTSVMGYAYCPSYDLPAAIQSLDPNR